MDKKTAIIVSLILFALMLILSVTQAFLWHLEIQGPTPYIGAAQNAISITGFVVTLMVLIEENKK